MNVSHECHSRVFIRRFHSFTPALPADAFYCGLPRRAPLHRIEADSLCGMNPENRVVLDAPRVSRRPFHGSEGFHDDF